MKRSLLLGAALLCAIFMVSGQRTNAKQAEAPIIHLPNQGSVMGKEISVSRSQKISGYFGIPYAQPPLGQLRFSAPVKSPLPSWNEVRNATQFGPSCQQVTGRRKLHEKLYLRLLPADLPDPGTSEDCLFLNIYVPDGNRPPEGWPVLVWFHGGDFNTGSPAIWDASVFVSKQKILVVTVAYRLNILGFFTTGDGEATGNYGMMDQVAALDWIKSNINLFDGSPSNVVIHGHSSGAISVGLHLVSPHSQGKFGKAIAMSGDALNSVGTPKAETSVVDIVTEKFGCYREPTSSLMECLRRVNVAILVRESSDIETWGPIIDGMIENATDPFLPEHPKTLLDTGSFHDAPLLAGYTSNEQGLVYSEASNMADGKLSARMFESIISDETMAAIKMPEENVTCEMKPEMVAEAVLFFYKPHPPSQDQTMLRDRYLELQTDKNFAAGLMHLASKVSTKSKAFLYKFDYRSRTRAMTDEVPDWAQVPHMFELPFVWGLPFLGNSIQWNPADKKMADTMMSMFAAFAKTGNPSFQNVKWEAFTEKEPGVLLIEKSIEMGAADAINYKALAFWNEYYPRIVEQSTDNCCNASNSATNIHDLLNPQLLSTTALIAIAMTLN